MRFLIALSLLPIFTTATLAAEVKGSSTIDAVTVYPAGAEVTRIGKVTVDRGEHTLAVHGSPC